MMLTHIRQRHLMRWWCQHRWFSVLIKHL